MRRLIGEYGYLRCFGKAATVWPELKDGLIDSFASSCKYLEANQLALTALSISRLQWHHGCAAAEIVQQLRLKRRSEKRLPLSQMSWKGFYSRVRR